MSLMAACVPLPYKVAVEANKVEPISADSVMLVDDPKFYNWVLDLVGEELHKKYPQIDIVSEDKFYSEISPDSRKVGALLKPETHERLYAHGIAYVVLLSGQTESSEMKGPWVWPLGIATGTVDAQLTATIVRTGDVALSSGLHAKGGGTGTVASYGWTIIVMPMAVESVAERISDAIGERIEADGLLNKAKIVLLKVQESSRQSEVAQQPVFADASEKELWHKVQEGQKATQGEPESQLQLYYSTVSSDPASAHRWLCKSADHGHPDARDRLALLYEHGSEGFDKGLVRAYMWYALAAQSGSYWGAHNAKRIRDNDLDPALISAAENAVVTWQVGQCEDGLN